MGGGGSFTLDIRNSATAQDRDNGRNWNKGGGGIGSGKRSDGLKVDGNDAQKVESGGLQAYNDNILNYSPLLV